MSFKEVKVLTLNEVIEKCQENAGYYYKYKKVVDNLLKEKGFLPFSSVA